MTMDFAEHMTVEGLVCSTHTFAVEPYRKSLPSPPRFNLWPSRSNGYRPPGKSGNAAMSTPCS
ncbi:hypothetical protein [Massilia oculi]|uniref:hypothetical protein n=1 Tax=Massilia oculi TaxID=945844 RepID=UPI0013B428F5|nr:hypothetical protein [Massilia oculi]